jgi:hypothetical protein
MDGRVNHRKRSGRAAATVPDAVDAAARAAFGRYQTGEQSLALVHGRSSHPRFSDHRVTIELVIRPRTGSCDLDATVVGVPAAYAELDTPATDATLIGRVRDARFSLATIPPGPIRLRLTDDSGREFVRTDWFTVSPARERT